MSFLHTESSHKLSLGTLPNGTQLKMFLRSIKVCFYRSSCAHIDAFLKQTGEEKEQRIGRKIPDGGREQALWYLTIGSTHSKNYREKKDVNGNSFIIDLLSIEKGL